MIFKKESLWILEEWASIMVAIFGPRGEERNDGMDASSSSEGLASNFRERRRIILFDHCIHRERCERMRC
jgi:hypothetical protein